MIKISKIQFKRGKKAALIRVLVGANKPAQGELIYEIDTGNFKIGTGLQDYVDLPYASGGQAGEQIVFCESKYELPAVGSEAKLYVLRDGSGSYLWQDKWVLVGNGDGSERCIDAGGADADYNII